MNLQKTYAAFCIFSLMLFFTNSVSFYVDVVFETFEKLTVEKADMGENENESESQTPTPSEEEEKHQTISSVLKEVQFRKVLNMQFVYFQFYWESIHPRVFTPPPELA